MPSLRLGGALAIFGIGFILITLIPVAVESWATTPVLVGVAGVGGVVMSVGGILYERVRQSEGEYDERQIAIRYRSGWYAYWLVMAPAAALWSVKFFADPSVPLWAIQLVFPGGVVIHSASLFVLKRRM